jgi:hypothetical protein
MISAVYKLTLMLIPYVYHYIPCWVISQVCWVIRGKREIRKIAGCQIEFGGQGKVHKT